MVIKSENEVEKMSESQQSDFALLLLQEISINLHTMARNSERIGPK